MVALFLLAVHGRFLQTDPVGYADQMNLYTYVANDPINKIDPMGMEGYSCITGTACQVKSDADFNASIPENVRQFEEQIIADKYGGRTLADLEADPTYHAYSNIGVLCTDCTVADVSDDYGRQPAPTWDGSIKDSPVQSGDITRGVAAAPKGAYGFRVPLPGGTVRHEVDPNSGAIGNITTGFHTLDPGHIIRVPIQSGDMVLSLTIGRGVGKTPRLNEFYGARLFNELDEKIASGQ